jgi:hypothetical protein
MDCIPSDNEKTDDPNEEPDDDPTEEMDCPICLENCKHLVLVKTDCGHSFCQPCYDRITICALCRRDLNKNTNPDGIHVDYVYLDSEERRRFMTDMNHLSAYNVLRIMAGMGGLTYSN